MAKNQEQLFKFFQQILAITIIVVFALYGCESKKTGESFILDNIQYELNSGGVGYDVKDDNSLDLNKASFIAILRITNLTKSMIKFDSSNFKLTDKNKVSVSLKTKMSDTDVSAMYKKEIEPGATIDHMLTFPVPKEGHYDLHIISPLSGKEKILHY